MNTRVMKGTTLSSECFVALAPTRKERHRPWNNRTSLGERGVRYHRLTLGCWAGRSDAPPAEKRERGECSGRRRRRYGLASPGGRAQGERLPGRPRNRRLVDHAAVRIGLRSRGDSIGGGAGGRAAHR